MHPLINEEALEIRQKYLDQDSEARVLLDWVKMDAQMRRYHVHRASWPYDFDIPKIGSTVVVSSSIATVVDFGIIRNKEDFERCVWVRLNNGTFLKVGGYELKVISEKEKKDFERKNEELKSKLIQSSQKIEKMSVEKKTASKQIHLNAKFISIANEMGLTVHENSGFHKIVGSKKGRAVYISKSGGRIDLSGFQFTDANVTNISDEEAKARHLGKVRGQFIFSSNEESMIESFKNILGEIQ